MALLCGIVARKRHEKVIEEIALAGRLEVGLAEVRLDFLPRGHRFRDLTRNKQLPLVATFRRKQDGGLFSGSEEHRRALLRSAAAEGFDYIDVEADVFPEIPKFGRTKRIVSFHDMNGVPDNLEGIFGDLQRLDADVVKIAVRAKSSLDVFRVLKLQKEADRPTVIFAMGERGFASRILGAKFGAPFTYAALNPLRIVAPGLPTVEEMRDIYFYEKIDSQSQMFGVIGDPIMQSLSPLVHNTSFRQMGINATYVPFRVTAQEFATFAEEAHGLGIHGLSVTIPHKRAAAELGIQGDALVGTSKSANTLIRDGATWRAFNTDGPAAVEAIINVIPEDPDSGIKSLGDRAVLLLGAGGAARSIAAALLERGAFVTIAARRDEEAKALAAELRCRAVEWEERYVGVYDVIVNCTPLGMYPDINGSAYHQSALRPGLVVLDTVYNPENTVLVREAKFRECRVASGVDMFVGQAEAQFRLFTDGQTPPPGLMAELVREELSPAKAMLRRVRLQSADDSMASHGQS